MMPGIFSVQFKMLLYFYKNRCLYFLQDKYPLLEQKKNWNLKVCKMKNHENFALKKGKGIIRIFFQNRFQTNV